MRPAIVVGVALFVIVFGSLSSLRAAARAPKRDGRVAAPGLSHIVTFRRYSTRLDDEVARTLRVFIRQIVGLRQSLRKTKVAPLRLVGHSDCREVMQQRQTLSLRRLRVVRDRLIDGGLKRGELELEARGCTKPLGTKAHPLYRYVQIRSTWKPSKGAPPRRLPHRPKPKSDPVPTR
ncbi:MAG: OmpA family protein [Myxococcales bacterium]|nr:OmpA family protein [Myxococcales bacterium]